MDMTDNNSILNITINLMNLLDQRLINHGEHTAYILYKMLQYEGKYSAEEIKKFVIIAVIHDIGVYKTDEIESMFRSDERGVWGHSVYAYLHFDLLPSYEQYAAIILYHHLRYDKTGSIQYQYIDIASYIKIADKIDMLLRKNSGKFGKGYLEEGRGAMLNPRGIDLFYEADKKMDILDNIRNNTYMSDLYDVIHNIKMNREESIQWIKFLIYTIDYGNRVTLTKTVAANSLSASIGEIMGLSKEEAEDLAFASLVYDIGMLAIPSSIIDAPRELTSSERTIIQTHVEITKAILKGNVKETILETAVHHHERLDGSGYPEHLVSDNLSLADRILAVSDILAALYINNNHRMAMSKEEIIHVLSQDTINKRLCPEVVKKTVENFDSLTAKADTDLTAELSRYNSINGEYEEIIKKFEEFN